MFNNIIHKPQKRSYLRNILGKEFYILKRKFKWYFSATSYSKINSELKLYHYLIKHKSILLRQLKDVDMYLQYNKIKNLKIAISKIDKVIIKPGEVFSIWKLVGKPTKSKGYLEGLALHNGSISKDIGGGLCQLGNLIYWMALHSPLEIKERWRHSYDVFPDQNRSIPFACGATLSYNYIDLQLKNNTDYTFQMNLWLDEEYLNGNITCDRVIEEKYEILETDHQINQQWWGGYSRHNKIWKKITNPNDNSSKIEFVAENSAIMMYNPLLES